MTDLVTSPTHHASMSRTEELLQCQWWASPVTWLPPQPEKSPDIPRFGTAVHKTLELHRLKQKVDIAAIAVEQDVDADKLGDYYSRGSKVVDSLLKNVKGTEEYEAKYAYDPFTDKGRKLKSKKERDYSEKKITELPGTVDVNVVQPKEFFVLDYKTGNKVYDIKTNGQLRSLSLAISKTHGLSSGIRVILRIDEDFIEPYEERINVVEMEAHRKVLRPAMRAMLSLTPNLRPGTYCNWCPALEVCPAQGGPLVLRDLIENAIEPAQVSHIYGKLLAIENLTKKVREKIHTYIEQNGPIDLDNGKSLILKPISKDNLSQASIKRALGAINGQELIDDLRKKGCIEESNYTSLTMAGSKAK